jgi:hypothetical protein
MTAAAIWGFIFLGLIAVVIVLAVLVTRHYAVTGRVPRGVSA